MIHPSTPTTKRDADKYTCINSVPTDHQAHTSVSSTVTTVTNAPATRAPAAAFSVGVTVGDGDIVLVDVGRIEVDCTITVVESTGALCRAVSRRLRRRDEDTHDDVLNSDVEDDAMDDADVLAAVDVALSVDAESVTPVEPVAVELFKSVALLDESVALMVDAEAVSVAVVLSDAEAVNVHQSCEPIMMSQLNIQEVVAESVDVLLSVAVVVAEPVVVEEADAVVVAK